MNNKYIKFWSWFIQNKALFEKLEISDNSIEQIDQQIRKLGDFAWEIGPGHKKSMFLTISPGGDGILLEITKEIISQAPEIDNWEFYYAKPVKDWDNYFDVVVDGENIGIDISNWKYILFRNGDNSYDVQVKPYNLSVLLLDKDNEDELYGIVEMVLESIIGEEARIEKISNLEVITDFQIDAKDSSILNLKKHLDSLG